MRKTAINIKTEKWNEIISELRKRDWIVTAKYYGFDAGIDDDFLILRKGFKKILFGWTNWFEGEIKCNDRIFEYLESKLKLEFEYGEPTSLKPLVISTYRIQSLPLFLVKKTEFIKELKNKKLYTTTCIINYWFYSTYENPRGFSSWFCIY